MHSVIVNFDPTAWAAVPANNGGSGPSWQWGDEILIGFTRGTFLPYVSFWVPTLQGSDPPAISLPPPPRSNDNATTPVGSCGPASLLQKLYT